MVRVCQGLFPETDGFYLDDKLKDQLDLLIMNVVDDWEYSIIISGGGEVRVGKSMLAMQIGTYWTYQMKVVHGIEIPFSLYNIVFDYRRLIKRANKIAKEHRYVAFIYDEAGETMDTSKTQTKELRTLRDYLRECGQYNFLNIFVLPEFFTLPTSIALTRTTFLLDVYYTANEVGKFERGFFNFYSRRQKKYLYINGKKELNYKSAPYNFDGRFYKFYPIDKEEYSKKKRYALRTREYKKNIQDKSERNALLYLVHKVFNQETRVILRYLHKLCGNLYTDALIPRACKEVEALKPDVSKFKLNNVFLGTTDNTLGTTNP